VNSCVGVLALQGAFAAHCESLSSIGVKTVEVRTPEQLASVDALLMPGGESSTMSQLLESSGLFDPIAARIAEGMPTFGTCAGMILLSSEILDGRSDQRSFSAIDISVRRNAFGRQVDSFESDLDFNGSSLHAVFIRAPWVEEVGAGVEVLSKVGDHAVAVRQGNLLATSFHPELTHDFAVHRYFFEEICKGR
jgi:5'-phosphate synthase pdxT subunit